MPEPILPTHRLLTAELLSIGSELTVGDTRDTNAGELARSLTGMGVRVHRLTALPDDLEAVSEAFRLGIARSDLVVSTGGLGPTPDDLTRESIAAACAETPVVDPDLEAWLRELWRRRGLAFPELNLKQAWRIPSASILDNPNGTAPGWLVTRPDGHVVVALPGPPREMRPMWADQAVPRLQAIGLGTEVAARTYRLTGIGESQVADLLGERLLRTANPVVATYARTEAVDVRVSAVAAPPRSAEELVSEAAATVLEHVGAYVWATGDTTWSEAIGQRLSELGWTMAAVEIGTSGSLSALLGDTDWFRFDQIADEDAPAARDPELEIGHHDEAEAALGSDLLRFAHRARELGAADVGVAVRSRFRSGDTAVSIALSAPTFERQVSRVVFLTGSLGRSRAALAAAAFILEGLRGPTAGP